MQDRNKSKNVPSGTCEQDLKVQFNKSCTMVGPSSYILAYSILVMLHSHAVVYLLMHSTLFVISFLVNYDYDCVKVTQGRCNNWYFHSERQVLTITCSLSSPVVCKFTCTVELFSASLCILYYIGDYSCLDIS